MHHFDTVFSIFKIYSLLLLKAVVFQSYGTHKFLFYLHENIYRIFLRFILQKKKYPN